ncbi:FtsH protease activity modulator HflK [Anaerotalea alkaliphila]|uniref:Protein HflK n=1 Tax=Anaerotalea alkaliphila TaxID=2662126 RepID=A0A7X5HUJ9_9FIRM|nr:FtsH protease activity modulator HflK [Anaerotalea alkaliphila]NDL66923.1 FtsH protease activity modulator HflK [Anaerotalea alkaliphila]
MEMNNSPRRGEEEIKDVHPKFKNMKTHGFRWGFMFLLVLGAAFLFFQSFFVLQDNENGVVLRLGQLRTVERQPGPHFKLPFIEEVTKVNVRNVYNMEYGFRILRAGTEQSDPVYEDNPQEATVIVDAAANNASIALLELIIQYRIYNPTDYLFKVDDVEGTLRLALEDTIRSTVQTLTLDEAKTQKELLDMKVMPLLQKKMDDYGAGIEILLVGTQNMQFLPSVEEAYQQKENANQYKNGKMEDAEKYNNMVIPRATAEATKLLEEASGYKAKTVAEAKAAMASYDALYEEYRKNPAILKERYYVEAIQSFLENNTIVVDATESGNLYKFLNMTQDTPVKAGLVEN